MASYKRKRNYGRERALQHIQEAKDLSRELGGTDQDVKQWFFSRSRSEMRTIFNTYRENFGGDAADYAEDTYSDWKSGKRKMSGVVAGRLFSLLPPIMPIEDKFQLVDSLWQHVGPTKKRLITAGSQADVNEILSVVKKEILMLTTDWTIPVEIASRFSWLSGNDSKTYQTLLSHIKESERQLGVRVIEEQVPNLVQKFETDWSETTGRLSYIVEVGKQSVEIRLVGNSESVVAQNWYAASGYRSSDSEGTPYLWFLTLMILIGFFVKNCS
jgi:hypothetical protein